MREFVQYTRDLTKTHEGKQNVNQNTRFRLVTAGVSSDFAFFLFSSVTEFFIFFWNTRNKKEKISKLRLSLEKIKIKLNTSFTDLQSLIKWGYYRVWRNVIINNNGMENCLKKKRPCENKILNWYNVVMVWQVHQQKRKGDKSSSTVIFRKHKAARIFSALAHIAISSVHPHTARPFSAHISIHYHHDSSGTTISKIYMYLFI